MSDELVSFENRWTSGARGRHWMLRLEREGEANVCALYADHELHSPDERLLIEDIPIGFARDWLVWHQQAKRRRRRNRHRVVVVLLVVAIVASALLAWRLDI